MELFSLTSLLCVITIALLFLSWSIYSKYTKSVTSYEGKLKEINKQIIACDAKAAKYVQDINQCTQEKQVIINAKNACDEKVAGYVKDLGKCLEERNALLVKKLEAITVAGTRFIGTWVSADGRVKLKIADDLITLTEGTHDPTVAELTGKDGNVINLRLLIPRGDKTYTVFTITGFLKSDTVMEASTVMENADGSKSEPRIVELIKQ